MDWTFIQPEKDKKPSISYKIKVIFSLHCFTKKDREDDNNTNLDYSDDRETRTFCFDRYELSRELPGIIERLGQGYVFHTGRQNFLKIDIGKSEYEVFFTIKRSKDMGVDLDIYVQSAYERTKGNTPKAGKIRFHVIAFNILNGKPIKVHKR